MQPTKVSIVELPAETSSLQEIANLSKFRMTSKNMQKNLRNI